jgi:Calcineurin-like phosphoesterase
VSHQAPHNLVMRFIHTADWQIGMRAVHAGSAAETVRAARIESAQSVCDLARREAVDFVLLAGDTFEDNGVDRDLVARVAEILASPGCPVFILPGNHDPIQPGSVWGHPIWATIPSVTILKEQTPINVPGGTLLPCPIFVRRSQEDPTKWITGSREEGIRVVVAHGNVGEMMAEEGGFPIDIATPTRCQADYVALGHWHSTVQYSSGVAIRMAYSGTHESTSFGEPDSGNVLIVTIATPGAIPEIKTQKMAKLRWERIGAGELITAPGKLADIARALSQLPNPEATLVEVGLKGLLFEVDQDEIPRIRRACERFLHARLDFTGLRAAPSDTDWAQHLPAGAVRASAARLQEMAAGTGEIAEIATQALLELYGLAQEVRQ